MNHLGKEAQSHQAPDESRTLEHALGVLLGQLQQSTDNSTRLGQHILSTPDFALATESIPFIKQKYNGFALKNVFEAQVVNIEKRREWRRGTTFN